jgi:hypothetical protein
MSKRIKGLADNFGETIGAHAGVEAQEQVMERSSVLKNGLDEEVLNWFIGAVEKLDDLVDRTTCVQIMRECGHNCAEVNKKSLQRLIAKREKYDSLNDFLDAEIGKPSRIMRIERQGSKIIQVYSPRSQGAGLRCFCGPWRNLPDEKKVSETWCQCSAGFVEKLWEGYAAKPVRVKLLESALQGHAECKFEIYL